MYILGSIIIALLLTPLSLPAAADDTITRGKILIANEALNDPNFDSAVVLIVGHSNLGTLGLVVNRPIKNRGTPLPPQYRSMLEDDVLFFGGPVTVDGPRALAASRFTIPGAIHISGELYFLDNAQSFDYLLGDSPETDALPERQNAIRSVRVYRGISSWIPGQLQAEINAGAWYVQDGSEDIVFSTSDSLWEDLVTNIHAKWVDRVSDYKSLPDIYHPTYNESHDSYFADTRTLLNH